MLGRNKSGVINFVSKGTGLHHRQNAASKLACFLDAVWNGMLLCSGRLHLNGEKQQVLAENLHGR